MNKKGRTKMYPYGGYPGYFPPPQGPIVIDPGRAPPTISDWRKWRKFYKEIEKEDKEEKKKEEEEKKKKEGDKQKKKSSFTFLETFAMLVLFSPVISLVQFFVLKHIVESLANVLK